MRYKQVTQYGDPNYWNQQNWINNNPQLAPPNSNWIPQVRTNKILVTSLDEALSKNAERYSEMYYWDQSKPVIYVIRTDQNGVKSWAEIPYTIPNQANSTPVTKADLDAVEVRLKALETKLGKKAKQETIKETNEDVESVK